jgi:23S rRNA (uridine2552-2'-O)-methyltransferase
MPKRSKSSDRWLKEHFRDPYVQRAQSGGWRSRAVFKLEEIDQRERLLKPGALCLDLGAAPGAWSQYARGRVGAQGRVVASDILPMEPLDGVEFVQGDFREDEVFGRVLSLLPEGQVDVVLSDMAPAMSGIDVTDQARSMHLAEIALDMTRARHEFGRVKVVKPQASRARSPEMYLLAMKFRLV